MSVLSIRNFGDAIAIQGCGNSKNVLSLLCRNFYKHYNRVHSGHVILLSDILSRVFPLTHCLFKEHTCSVHFVHILLLNRRFLCKLSILVAKIPHTGDESLTQRA